MLTLDRKSTALLNSPFDEGASSTKTFRLPPPKGTRRSSPPKMEEEEEVSVSAEDEMGPFLEMYQRI